MDVETKGNAILDGNVPPSLENRTILPPTSVFRVESRLVNTAPHFGYLYAASDRNTTPIVLTGTAQRTNVVAPRFTVLVLIMQPST